MQAPLQAGPTMNRLWQHCAALAFGQRRASVASSARAVRPATLAASARASVFQGLGRSAQNCNVLEPWWSSTSRVSLVTVAPELIARPVSRKVDAMRPSPNPRAESEVSIGLRRTALQPGCAFVSVGARPLPVAVFGTRGGPNPSFKRTGLRPAA